MGIAATPMNAQELVDRFQRLLASCVQELMNTYEGRRRPGAGQPFVLMPRGGGAEVREGDLVSGTHFKLHGIGCEFELESGEVVDVDWDSQGRAVFDAWRVVMFARSLGDESTGRESLHDALRTSRHLRAAGDDRFTWLSSRFDFHLA